MQLRFFGGIAVEGGVGPSTIPGRGQQALLLRLALDAGSTVTYRALSEDIWGQDRPDDPRAALQSLASRLRRSLPPGTLEAVPGGYRLAVARDDVDLTRFADLVAAARTASDPSLAAALAHDALALWSGDPWTPEGMQFDWVRRDLLEDRAHAERLAKTDPAPAPATLRPGVPAAMTSLVGRSPELGAIAEQLSTSRLVTLIGPGGAGKTTLALETARTRPAAVVAELAPAARGEVWTAIAGAVGRSIRLTDSASMPANPRERVRDALAGRNVLLVLDNCEHVVEEAAAAAQDLLRALAGVRVLATSREPLGVPGEAFVDLGPLPAADGAELFARRMRAASGTGPGADDAEVVERIVRRLDGLPLALELAAAKTRTLTLAEIDQGLDDRFALLASGPRAGAARHQTLRALIDWSWDTIAAPERAALMSAAVFPDGFAATDAPVIERETGVAAGAFDALVDRSLLTRRNGRFRMLETVREYGLERLRESGDEAEVRRRGARALAELALAQDARLRGPGMSAGLAWFDANDENLSAAMRHCAAIGDRTTGVRLVRSLLWSWTLRERLDEVQEGIASFTSDDDPLDSEASVVVRGVGLMLTLVSALDDDGDTPGGAGFAARATAVAAAARAHRTDLSGALMVVLGAARRALAQHRAGEPWWPRDIRITDADLEGASPWALAAAYTLRAATAQNAGEIDRLGAESDRALRMFRELGDPWGVAFASQMRSEWLMLQGRLEEALDVVDRSSAAFEGLSSIADAVQQRSQSVALLVRLGRVDEARGRMREIDEIARADGSERARTWARMTAAGLEVAVGDGAAALRELDELGPAFPAGSRDEVVAWSQSQRAEAFLLLGEPDRARAALQDAVPAGLRSGDYPVLSDVAVALAGWLAVSDRPAEAARALDIAAALRGRADDADPFRRWVRERTDTAPREVPGDAASAFADLAALLE